MFLFVVMAYLLVFLFASFVVPLCKTLHIGMPDQASESGVMSVSGMRVQAGEKGDSWPGGRAGGRGVEVWGRESQEKGNQPSIHPAWLRYENSKYA
jgi:hypothetical protein